MGRGRQKAKQQKIARKLKYCYITISVNVLSWSKRIQFEELEK